MLSKKKKKSRTRNLRASEQAAVFDVSGAKTGWESFVMFDK